MINKKFVIVGIVLTFCVFCAVFFINLPLNTRADGLTAEEKAAVFSQVISSRVIATLQKDANIYEDINDNARQTLKVWAAGTEVEILQDKTRQWYQVYNHETQEIGWVKAENLRIPEDPETVKDAIPQDALESFVNEMAFESDTDTFVYTDIARQKTYIFHGVKGDWRLYRTLECATGKNESPTVKGIFTISDRGEWFYSDRLESGARYWVRFHNSYLFHSVAMDKNKNVIDGVLGERRSSGCVRFAVEDAKWFYENVPDNTRVFVH